MVNQTKIKALLETSVLQQLEDSVAGRLKCNIYKEDSANFIKFIKDEIEASNLSLQEIETIIMNYPDKIIHFSDLLWGKSTPKRLAPGISIKYSIYLIFLEKGNKMNLLEYLKKRRIPKPQALLEQLLSIKEEMTI